MALAEEPWLEAAYGAAYRRYCRAVPRFFDWRRAGVLAASILRRVQRRAAVKSAAAAAAQLISTGWEHKRYSCKVS